MRLTSEVAGRSVEVETFDDWISGIDARAILAGETYPIPSDLTDVEVVLDIGANVGATSVYLACHFPGAEIHSFEPAPATYDLLVRNTTPFDNVTTHPIGLHEEAGEVDLYQGLVGPGQASIEQRPTVAATSDRIRLESAGEWWESSGLERIDVLKMDTEGCEVPILRSLGSAIAGVKVLFVELHSTEDLATAEAMLAPTHTAALGRRLFETSEVMYVRRDLVEHLRPGIIGTALSTGLNALGG